MPVGPTDTREPKASLATPTWRTSGLGPGVRSNPVSRKRCRWAPPTRGSLRRRLRRRPGGRPGLARASVQTRFRENDAGGPTDTREPKIALVENGLPEVAELFLELARVPSPSGQERAVADQVIEYLRALALPVDEDDAGTRIDSTIGNLLCRIEPSGEGAPLFFCAHLDTVPPDGPIDPGGEA